MTTSAHENPSNVSSIELFFDLVFVFVITQVTQLVEHAHGAMDFLRALLVLVPIWWMYAGYAWLTNNVRVTWQMRLVLIAAMASPEVFGAGALTFGFRIFSSCCCISAPLRSRDRELRRRRFLAWRLSIS